MSDTVWSYRDTTWSQDSDLVGYDVEASDGSIGKIDEASNEASGQWLVVDTGFWIFGKKRLVPAGAVTGIDHEGKTVMVDLTKDQVKSAPDYDKDDWNDDSRGQSHGLLHAVLQPLTPAHPRDDAPDDTLVRGVACLVPCLPRPRRVTRLGGHPTCRGRSPRCPSLLNPYLNFPDARRARRWSSTPPSSAGSSTS